MNVIRVIPSGYCKGVVNAIELVKKTRSEYPLEKIYILGMIVHNSFVTRELENLGVITLDDSIKSKEEWIDEIDDGIIIFTAHGISDSIKNKALNKGLFCVDATCEDVLKTKDLIKDYLNKGYEVIYLGKNNHPEANAVISISKNIHLITKIEDVNDLNIKNEKLILTNQTTMSSLELKEIIDEVKKKYPSVLVKNDICQATSSRQKAIMDLKDAHLLYIVGDIKSNNTNMLKEIGIKSGIDKVELISDYTMIKDEDLTVDTVYVSAGASTPPKLINEVIDYLRNK